MDFEQGLLAAVGALAAAVVHLYWEQRSEARNCRAQLHSLWNHVVNLTLYIAAGDRSQPPPDMPRNVAPPDNRR